MLKFDVIIIGAGIVGLATAWQLSQRCPKLKIAILEKESDVAKHQTGHNSGVLHSGIYYKPGSLKASNCRQGKLAMQKFCLEYEIPFELCGKVIVATQEGEIPSLQMLYQRGLENGINCSLIDRDRLREIEPYVAGLKAIHVPEAGIVDYGQVARKLAQLLVKQGHEIFFESRVISAFTLANERIVTTHTNEFSAKLVVNCAGLYSDKIAKTCGDSVNEKIIPFRGEYFELRPEATHLCKHLVYPVPDIRFPFLGVHFTRMIGGGVECGPNAVLALAREGYKKTTINPIEFLETLTYPGFLRIASRYWRMGAHELWRSFSKTAFTKALQRLIPEVTSQDLTAVPAGVRAQAVSFDGRLIDDFLISEGKFDIHVKNAPSPAATASLNIGKAIAAKAEARF
jgi:L-2-hydroxyglutarate oxidase